MRLPCLPAVGGGAQAPRLRGGADLMPGPAIRRERPGAGALPRGPARPQELTGRGLRAVQALRTACRSSWTGWPTPPAGGRAQGSARLQLTDRRVLLQLRRAERPPLQPGCGLTVHAPGWPGRLASSSMSAAAAGMANRAGVARRLLLHSSRLRRLDEREPASGAPAHARSTTSACLLAALPASLLSRECSGHAICRILRAEDTASAACLEMQGAQPSSALLASCPRQRCRCTRNCCVLLQKLEHCTRSSQLARPETALVCTGLDHVQVPAAVRSPHKRVRSAQLCGCPAGRALGLQEGGSLLPSGACGTWRLPAGLAADGWSAARNACVRCRARLAHAASCS